MARAKVTKRLVEAVEPGERDVIVWDTALAGFGLKVTPLGRRVYFLKYRVGGGRGGQVRKPKIGQHGVITCEQAREIAQMWLREVAAGRDPSGERQQARIAPTIADLAERYLAEHAIPHKKLRSVEEDKRNLRLHVLPALGRKRVHDVTREDVQRLHHALRHMPTGANRVLQLLSKMFNLAEVWRLRPDGSNPTRHVKQYKERARERYLSEAELGRLGAVLESCERERSEPSAVITAIRLLLSTGCRRDEIRLLRWEDVRLDRGCLTLPDSKAGAREVPLSPEAVEVLERTERKLGNPYVVASERIPGAPITDLERPWRRIRERAGLTDVRLHDLRHSFAAVGAGAGLSLPLIGALLGHHQAQTTKRYAHLAEAVRREAAAKVGARLSEALQGRKVAILSR